MKLITIITTVLISFSSFGQDLIKYQDFKFYQNGTEVSLDRMTELTKEFGVAKADFRQARRDYAASQNRIRALGRNVMNGTLAYSAGFSALISFGLGAYWVDGGLSDGDFHPAMYITAFTSGTVLTGCTVYYSRLLAKRKKFKKRADKKFQRTAEKLNQAMMDLTALNHL